MFHSENIPFVNYRIACMNIFKINSEFILKKNLNDLKIGSRYCKEILRINKIFIYNNIMEKIIKQLLLYYINKLLLVYFALFLKVIVSFSK